MRSDKSHGKKTAAAAVGFGAMIGPAFCDPTGISLLTCAGLGVSAGVGSAYHAGRRAKALVKDKRKANVQEGVAVENIAVRRVQNEGFVREIVRQKVDLGKHTLEETDSEESDVEKNDSGESGPQRSKPKYSKQFQGSFTSINGKQLEKTLRKLSVAVTGVTVGTGFAIIMPHVLLGVGLNLWDIYRQSRKLRQMAKAIGGSRELLRYMREHKTAVALQITAGIFLKLMTTTIFLGHEFDTVIQGYSDLHGGESEFHSLLPDIMAEHSDWIDEGGVLHMPVAIVNEPADLVNHLFNMPDDHVPVWPDLQDSEGVQYVSAAGTAQALVDTTIVRLADNAGHKIIDRVGGTR